MSQQRSLFAALSTSARIRRNAHISSVDLLTWSCTGDERHFRLRGRGGTGDSAGIPPIRQNSTRNRFVCIRCLQQKSDDGCSHQSLLEGVKGSRASASSAPLSNS